MEDKLKDFIRQSRHEFDRGIPGSSVFDGALSVMQRRRAALRKRRLVMAAAACLTTLIVAGIALLWSGGDTVNPEGGLAQTVTREQRLELPSPKATPSLPMPDPYGTALAIETHPSRPPHPAAPKRTNRKPEQHERTFVRPVTASESIRQELAVAEAQPGEQTASGQETGSLTGSREREISGNEEATTPAVAGASSNGQFDASGIIQHEVDATESAAHPTSQEVVANQEIPLSSNAGADELGDEGPKEAAVAQAVPEDPAAEAPKSNTDGESEHPTFSFARNVLRKVGRTLGEIRENALEKVEETDSGESGLAAQFSSGLIDLYKSYRSRRSED